VNRKGNHSRGGRKKEKWREESRWKGRKHNSDTWAKKRKNERSPPKKETVIEGLIRKN
jgi:hypothetical protein